MSKTMSAADKRALTKLEKDFAKAFGEGKLIPVDDKASYEVVSTGSLLLDYATGVGGLVEGRLVEYWGADGLGKTTMALLAMAEAQRKHPDKLTAFVDMEQTLDKALVARLGVDTSTMRLHEPDSAEDVANAMKMIVGSGLFSFVILDSIGAMIPEAEKEKDADEATVALQAKIVTRMVKILAVEARKSGCIVLFINQVRANVGGYGAATTTAGGFSLKHVTTHKMQFRRTATTEYMVGTGEDKVKVGHELSIVVERNKVAPPKRNAIVSLMNQATEKYGPVGIDRAQEAFQLGTGSVGGIDQAGAWYTTADGERFNGGDPTKAHLREHPELVDAIRQRAIDARANEVVHGIAAEVDVDKEDLGLGDAADDKPKFKKGAPKAPGDE